MKRAEHQPETISVTIYAGIFYKLYRVPDADTLMPQHAHQHDHLSALLQGSVRLMVDDRIIGDFTAPSTLRIPAHIKHTFLTLTPDVVLACIHNADHIENDEPVIAAEHVIVED
jgi:hypothetical protein